MKSSLVYISELIFSLLKNKWNFEEDWPVEDEIMGNLMISTLEKSQLVKNERS